MSKKSESINSRELGMSCRVTSGNSTRMLILGLVAIIGLASSLNVSATTYNLANGQTVSSNQVLSNGDNLVIAAAGTVYISGDREISLLDESGSTATIDIGASAGRLLTDFSNNGVTITPSVGGGDAQLVFNVAAGNTLTVNVWNNLSFIGNYQSLTENTGNNSSLYVTFRGKGQTVFRLPSGVQISFGDTRVPAVAHSHGTHVRVLMDQFASDAESTSQVVFEKWSYQTDSVNGFTAPHTYITFGANSSLIYCSSESTGTLKTVPGCGSIAFDPTNVGTGRLVLELGRGFSSFTDAAFNICGARVITTGDTSPTNREIRENISLWQRAGDQAIFRIVDNVLVRHYGSGNSALLAHRSDETKRRGLVVINHNNTFPRLANYFDQSPSLTASPWRQMPAVQPGFILGNNGKISIGQNLFLDYIAASINKDISGDENYGSHSNCVLKKHNPSALIVDGYAFYKRKLSGTSLYDNELAQAEIALTGNAGIFVRCGASSQTNDIVSRELDSSIACTLGRASYDGNVALITDNEGYPLPSQSSNLDGECAFDIEGDLKVSTTAFGDFAKGFINVPSILIDHTGAELKYSNRNHSLAGSRPLALSVANSNNPDAMIEYYRYNTSSILLNASLELHNTRLIHNDVTRDLSHLPDPSEDALPAIFGGEFITLQARRLLATEDSANSPLEYSGQPIYLFNSSLELHESLVLAGIHLVVNETVIDMDATSGWIDPENKWKNADNISSIVFYNRGVDLDEKVMGHGRVLQLGSRANVFMNGSFNNATFQSGTSLNSLRDSFIDIYRQRQSLDDSMAESELNTIKLALRVAQESGVSALQKPLQIIYLANRSAINLGWPTETADDRYAAWEFSNSVLDALNKDLGNSGAHRFTVYSYGFGELSIDGDNIYFGAGGRYASSGVLEAAGDSLAPQSASAAGGVIYVDHGGKISVTDNHNMHIDTIIARSHGSKKENSEDLKDSPGGQIVLPYDQIIYYPNGAIQTYGLSGLIGQASVLEGNTYPIATVHVPDFPQPQNPVKSFLLPHHELTRGGIEIPSTRSTLSVASPVNLPSSGLYVVSTGDNLEQFRVSAATRPNPFCLHASGDSKGFSRIREFVSIPSVPPVIGEGAFAALFVDNGARIGLGSRSYNEFSTRAWNQLGEDKVSIFPNGNAVIDLNSDLLVIDKLPLVATQNFGKDTSHRITFYSSVPHEIRIPAGGELDLSSFGQGNFPHGQQIAFGGKVSLVVEPGAKIRFPNITDPDKYQYAPVLYFNDDAQLIFDENNDPDWIQPSNVLEGLDKIRAKILGVGQIWTNKNAQVRVMGNAAVSIEADKQTPHTNVTLSLARQSGFYIGDANVAGGSFQIGNVVNGGGDGHNVVGTDSGARATDVSFNLVINGPGAKFHMDREAFFGIGAGITSKPTSNPNGWSVQSLFNVKNITLNLTRGFFDHNNIFDGTDSQSSAIALGSLDKALGGSYNLTIGDPQKMFIRGGGNLVYVGPNVAYGSPLALRILSTAAPLAVGDNSGKYSILAPGQLIRTYDSSDIIGSTITNDSNTFSFSSVAVTDTDSQTVAQVQTYKLLGMHDYVTAAFKYIAAGLDQFAVLAGYVNGTTIKRVPVTQAQSGAFVVSPTLALAKGYFIGSLGTASGDPQTFSVPQ